MSKLDEIALNTELVLISIIEGVALTNLAQNAVPILASLGSWQLIPYVLAGLAFLLVFWAQAILHTVSFIRWPIRMEHMLLYFVAGFLQVVAYSNLADIQRWFFWWSAFSLLTFIIYAVDLRIIRDMTPVLTRDETSRTIMSGIEERHRNEMRYLVPTALAFNIIMFLLAVAEPQWFVAPLAYAIPGILQFLISLAALIDCVRNFKARASVLTSLFSS